MAKIDEAKSREIFYVVAINPEPDYEDKFNQWYDTQHIPELMSCPGFKAARRYLFVDGEATAPKYLAVYDMESMDAFRSEEYLRLGRRSDDELTPLTREVRQHRSRFMNGKYREILNVTS